MTLWLKSRRNRHIAVGSPTGRPIAAKGAAQTTGSASVAADAKIGQPALVTKAEPRRAEMLEKMADHVLAHGLAASSLRPLAKAAGTSDRMLLYYFADKAEMMTAILSVIAGRIMAAMEARKAPQPLPIEQLQPLMLEAIVDEAMWPFMRVWLEIASLAANGDAFFRAVGEQLGRGFLAWGAAQIDAQSEAERQREAARLLVMAEGMVVLKSIGLGDVAAAAMQSDAI
jgi:AcrR family transcriptional regulator